MNADFLLDAFAGIDDDIVLDAGTYAQGGAKNRRGKVIRLAAVAAACILLLAIIPVALGSGFSSFFGLGDARKNALGSKGNETVVASYKDNQVTKAMIEYQHDAYESSVKQLESQGLSSDEIIRLGIKPKTDLEITNDILCGFIMLEEAEKQGLAATDAEIEEWVAQQKQSYNENPEAAENIDTYCRGAGITPDEYWEALSEEGYSTLSLQKFKAHMKEEYFAAHDAPTGEYSEEDVLAYNAAYDKYVEDYRSGLLEAHKDDIVYYDDAG